MLRQIKKQLVTDLALSSFSAFLLALSFSFSWCSLFAWFAFVPLFFVLENKNSREAFWQAYYCGILFWALTIYWLAQVTFIGQVILIFYLALYFGVFGCLICRPLVKCRILFIPALWVILEYLRGWLFTGFPWALLGYSQYANLAVIQVADIAGVWLVSFLVMLVNVAVSDTFIRARRRYLLIAGFLLTAVIFYGFYKLNKVENAPGLKISVVQGNIPQELKWNLSSREFILGRYFQLTEEARKDDPDLIIWPEAAFPVVPEEEPAYLEQLSRYVKASGRPLLFGAVTKRDALYYNSALLFSKEGRLVDKYDKLHLVPFGEYVPFKDTLRFLETIAPIGDITAGRDYTLFQFTRQKSKASAPKTGQPMGRVIRFGVLICFEDIFASLARNFVNKGADFLVNITNDAWFGKTSEAYQHLAAAVFRAVENRVYLVRSANTGISGFITPVGRAVALVSAREGDLIFVPGFKTQGISIRRQVSFYRYYGDFLVLLCLLSCLLLMLSSLSKKRWQKIFLILLLLVSIYSVINLCFMDRRYFICPIDYGGGFIIRADARGDGIFGSQRSGKRTHQGIDLFADVGTPVVAARSGIVLQAKSNRGMGNYVIIRHSPSLITVYGHLSRIDVARGQFIRQGHIIGSVGKTGNANYRDMQPHLHFEIRKGGIPQDPAAYLE